MGVLVKFKLELTEADVNVIGEALDEQPYKKVADLARRMQAQINEQMKAADAERKAAIEAAIQTEVAKRSVPPVPAKPKRPRKG